MDNKGNLAGLSLGLVVTLVTLFIGLYMVNTVGTTIFSENDLYDYTYSTETNTTSITIESGTNGSYSYSITLADTISGETRADKIESEIKNTNASVDHTVTLYLNGAKVTDITAENGTTVTSSDSVTLVTGTNNITYEGTGIVTADNGTVSIESSNITYPSSTESDRFGTEYDDLVSNTSTIYDVMILVIIIFALGVAISVLRNFAGSVGGGQEMAV